MLEPIVLDALALYALIGLVTAILFVTFGVSRVLGQGASVTMPARILWLPAAAALWPFVLVRWLTARNIQ
jgi:hypothetical protein